MSTIAENGIDFEISRKFDDDTITNLTIYDTAGQEQYSSLVPQYMRNAEGIMLVYSATDQKSFEQIKSLVEQVILAKEIDDLKLIPVILVANKIDLKNQRKVSTEEGQKYADEMGIPFMELSAKTRVNIDEAFEKLVAEVRRTRLEEEKKNKKNASGKKASGGKKKDCSIQ